jgi:hypothetical protein
MMTQGRGQWTRSAALAYNVMHDIEMAGTAYIYALEGTRSPFDGKRSRAWTRRRWWGRALNSAAERRKERYVVDNVNRCYLRPDLIGR